MHRLDRCWAEHGHGALARYTDDLAVSRHTKREAEAAHAALRAVLAEMGLPGAPQPGVRYEDAVAGGPASVEECDGMANVVRVLYDDPVASSENG